jgi:stearoyl-CoA desaturase (Delta-9 desaturase)
MSASSAVASIGPGRTRCPGVTPVAGRPRRTVHRTAMIVVVAPFACCLVAAVMLWNDGIGALDLALLAGMYLLTHLGIGVGYHRLVSHRSFETVRPVRVLLAILGSMAAQGPVIFWASTHRRHHAYSDRVGDPHSPNLHGSGIGDLLRGLWHAHTGWLFVHEVTDWARYTPELVRDRAMMAINRTYFVWIALGLLLPAAIAWAVTGTAIGAAKGFLWGGAVRTFLVHHTTWSVNSLTHVVGARPFRSRDRSRNNAVIAWLTLGDGWHNNHHAFPFSALHGLEWWQLDVNGIVIRCLARLGLAWNVQVPTARMLREARVS